MCVGINIKEEEVVNVKMELEITDVAKCLGVAFI
jgi:hypothetical protein